MNLNELKNLIIDEWSNDIYPMIEKELSDQDISFEEMTPYYNPIIQRYGFYLKSSGRWKNSLMYVNSTAIEVRDNLLGKYNIYPPVFMQAITSSDKHTTRNCYLYYGVQDNQGYIKFEFDLKDISDDIIQIPVGIQLLAEYYYKLIDYAGSTIILKSPTAHTEDVLSFEDEESQNKETESTENTIEYIIKKPFVLPEYQYELYFVSESVLVKSYRYIPSVFTDDYVSMKNSVTLKFGGGYLSYNTVKYDVSGPNPYKICATFSSVNIFVDLKCKYSSYKIGIEYAIHHLMNEYSDGSKEGIVDLSCKIINQLKQSLKIIVKYNHPYLPDYLLGPIIIQKLYNYSDKNKKVRDTHFSLESKGNIEHLGVRTSPYFKNNPCACCGANTSYYYFPKVKDSKTVPICSRNCLRRYLA